MELKTSIIPVKLYFYDSSKNVLLKDGYDYKNEPLDLKSIAFYAASGFFFNDATFYKNIKVVPPATRVSVGPLGNINSMAPYWNWHYSPVFNNLKEATDSFTEAFEKSIKKGVENKKVILPLSGGIDSRVVAAAIPENHGNVQSYSYEFENGIQENKFGRAIAKAKGFPFQEYTIPKSYLWDKVDELSSILKYYSEFTHPRQIALMDKLELHGDVFLLGHGGEVFKADTFANVSGQEEMEQVVFNIMVGKEGKELGEKLWDIWGLQGTFTSYVYGLINKHLDEISIKNTDSKIRAFIYKYIASRKNQVNVNVFGRNKDYYLPFMDEAVLEMVCKTEEGLLTKRKIQIEYIKRKSPKLASIAWQNYYPLNLYNYKRYYSPLNLPFRAYFSLKRKFSEKISGKKLIKRNWENQFLGEYNDRKLKHCLFDDVKENSLIPKNLVSEYYNSFKSGNSKMYFQPLSMLLTLSCFDRKRSALNAIAQEPLEKLAKA